MSSTEVTIYFCPGERYLKTGCSMSSILATDVNYVRALVADDVLDEPSVEAVVASCIERVEHAGALSPRPKEELINCLGKIARNECAYY